jgi:hypothetical protein
MTDRMAHALKLADDCWANAKRTEPEFVEKYLRHAEQLLRANPEVNGDEFRSICAMHSVRLPATLHHNTWVSGVRALRQIGWIKYIDKVEPTAAHNHMPEVTRWRSTLYEHNDGWVFE